jgi:tRNA uridine 5-carboxymethylaminomethyl modification enzyme
MFNGRIRSLGPRYCPSIEDKINRFADKERSVVYRTEGWKTCEVYVNGFSTSLPADIQFMKSIAGFQDVKFLRAGYAIEYDYFPTQLRHLRNVSGRFVFCRTNQRNDGYEEAAQGLMAGINAHLKVHEKSL